MPRSFTRFRLRLRTMLAAVVVVALVLVAARSLRPRPGPFTVFYVQGAVKSAGRFPATGWETALDGLALAGGPDPRWRRTPGRADPTVLLVRTNVKPARVIPLNLSSMRSRPLSRANPWLIPGDRLHIFYDPPPHLTKPAR